MEAAIHTFYVHNGLPVDRRYFLASSSGRPLTVYEVFRLIAKVPLFFEDHYQRMERSARLVGRTLGWTMAEMEDTIRRLIEVNQVTVGNVKIQVQWEGAGQGELFACFIAHHYPVESDYRKGVPVSLLEAERDNPNAKVSNLRIRQMSDELIRDRQVYEALLVDHNGFLTEGSRSNFFALHRGEILTPPVATVLPGITRGKVVDLCQRNGWPLRQEPIHLRDLPAIEAAFLSGTSPGILPVSRIDDQVLHPENPLLLQLRESYEEMVRQYIQTHHSAVSQEP